MKWKEGTVEITTGKQQWPRESEEKLYSMLQLLIVTLLGCGTSIHILNNPCKIIYTCALFCVFLLFSVIIGDTFIKHSLQKKLVSYSSAHFAHQCGDH